MYNPLISIIIPVYNGSNYLKESIDSALSQTYKNIELIIVNDGSDDDFKTEKIALSYGDQIKYYYKDNGGVASALNYGIKKMNGDWFSWLSHDDLYMPNKIESQVDKINKYNLDHRKTIISCNYSLIDPQGKEIYKPKKFKVGLYTGKEMFKELSKGVNLNGCSLLIPKISLKSVGCFKEEFKFIQDRVCWGDLSIKENYFYLYDEKLVKSRIHPNQDTIRLADLHPIEDEKYLRQLFNEFIKSKENGVFYIKTILFYYLTRIKNKDIKMLYLKSVKDSETFKLVDKFKYILLSFKGAFYMRLRKIYRHIINRKYRGAK